MKKKIVPICLTIVLVLGIVIFIVLSHSSSKGANDKKMNSYDYVIVGDNCSCQPSGKCKIIYGIKGDEVGIINKLKYNSNKETFYRVFKGKEEISYFDYNTWHKMYEELNYLECDGCDKQETAIKKYQKKYKYKEAELETFKTILSLSNRTFNSYIRYYIVSGNDYLVFNSKEEKLYKYNIENNTLDEFLELKTCDIDYFHKAK